MTASTKGTANAQYPAITYATNDTANPVTIILRKGPGSNLQTISTLTDAATGGQYVWTPSTSLPNADDYALEIQQGSQNNYWGAFALRGGSDGSVTPSAGAYATPSAGTSTTMNSTMTTAPMPMGTGVTMPVGNGTASMATGTSMPRNTTMSMATLTPTMSGTGSGSDSGASATGDSSSPSSSVMPTSAANEVQMGSAFALFVGAAAAAFYL